MFHLKIQDGGNRHFVEIASKYFRNEWRYLNQVSTPFLTRTVASSEIEHGGGRHPKFSLKSHIPGLV